MVIALGAVGWAWLSYALLYAAGAPKRAPKPGRWRVLYRVGAAATFVASAWVFGHVEGGLGGVVLASLAWTSGASVYPFVERVEPRVADASIGAALVAAALGALHAT